MLRRFFLTITLLFSFGLILFSPALFSGHNGIAHAGCLTSIVTKTDCPPLQSGATTLPMQHHIQGFLQALSAVFFLSIICGIAFFFLRSFESSVAFIFQSPPHITRPPLEPHAFAFSPVALREISRGRLHRREMPRA